MLTMEFLDHLLVVVAVGGKHEISSSDLDILFWKYQLTDDEKALAHAFLRSRAIHVVEVEKEAQEEEKGEGTIIDEEAEDNEVHCFELNDKAEKWPPEELQSLPPAIAHNWYKLTSREKKVLTHRFGIAGEAAHTLEETADAFGVSPERIKQIECKAYRRCHGGRSRKYLDYLDDYDRRQEMLRIHEVLAADREAEDGPGIQKQPDAEGLSEQIFAAMGDVHDPDPEQYVLQKELLTETLHMLTPREAEELRRHLGLEQNDHSKD